MPEKDSLYFFVNGKYVLKGDTMMAEVYEQRKDNDGFLYITYTDETTLGADQEWATSQLSDQLVKISHYI